MLALTDSAVEAVKGIISASAGESGAGGLRLMAEEDGKQTSFRLSVVPMPAEDDQVIEEDGARLFLETRAASLLDDKVLDASIEQGEVAFTIGDREEI